PSPSLSVPQYTYEGVEFGELTVHFNVVWDREFFIDKPADVKVVLYKCPAQRETCGECLRADPRLRCGWCSQEQECRLFQHCSSPDSNWLHPGARNIRCRHPHISQVP
uniref:PSI domain-containing protein n=1 Tax=Callorhinchus milii TaxID=7868 RepID=A0A4W3GK03_CALMI